MTEELGYSLEALGRSVLLALLATSEKFSRSLEDGSVQQERMSDQPRRVAILICTMSFCAGRESWWLAEQRQMAAMLEMDEGDCALALVKLEGWGVLRREACEEGLLLQILPSRLTLSERAQKAARAFARHVKNQTPMRQPQLPSARSWEDGGYADAMSDVDRETAGKEAEKSVGRFPISTALGWEIPNRELGESQLERGAVGGVPTGSVTEGARTRAGIGLQIEKQIVESRSGRSEGGSAGRFRDGDKNHTLERLEAMDSRGELAAELCRRTWVGRVRDHEPIVARSIDLVTEDERNGRPTKGSRLARIFVVARKMANEAGKTFRCLVS